MSIQEIKTGGSKKEIAFVDVLAEVILERSNMCQEKTIRQSSTEFACAPLVLRLFSKLTPEGCKALELWQ
jgi:hypothetical protein